MPSLMPMASSCASAAAGQAAIGRRRRRARMQHGAHGKIDAVLFEHVDALRAKPPMPITRLGWIAPIMVIDQGLVTWRKSASRSATGNLSGSSYS